MITLIIALLLNLAPATQPEVGPVVENVARTAGVDAWKDVKTIRFTCSMGRAADLHHRFSYEYDVVNAKVTVSDGEKQVTVSLKDQPRDEEAKRALDWWNRDSFFLFLSLRLRETDPAIIRRPDVQIEDETYQLLHLPEKKLDLYVDPATHLIVASIQTMPDNQRVRFGWSLHQSVNGLKLPMSFDGPGRRILISDFQVDR